MEIKYIRFGKEGSNIDTGITYMRENMMEYIWESFTYIFKDRIGQRNFFWGGIIGLIPYIFISHYWAIW